MSVVVNFYAGPSAGKSIASSDLCSELKKRGLYAEMVTEVAKEKVLKGEKFNKFDQFHLFGMQSKRETDLYDKVDIIVTDSPVPLNAAYGWVMDKYSYPNTFHAMATSHLQAQDDSQIQRVDIWLNRMGHFQKEGRIHDEREAINMDVQIRHFLALCGIGTTEFKVGEFTSSELADFVTEKIDEQRRN